MYEKKPALRNTGKSESGLTAMNFAEKEPEAPTLRHKKERTEAAARTSQPSRGSLHQDNNYPVGKAMSTERNPVGRFWDEIKIGCQRKELSSSPARVEQTHHKNQMPHL